MLTRSSLSTSRLVTTSNFIMAKPQKLNWSRC